MTLETGRRLARAVTHVENVGQSFHRVDGIRMLDGILVHCHVSFKSRYRLANFVAYSSTSCAVGLWWNDGRRGVTLVTLEMVDILSCF